MAEQARKDLDALDLLMQDHREVESLFREFDYLQQKGDDTAQVIATACAELKEHDAVENDIFYPAVSNAAGDEEIEALLDVAEDAHDHVLDLIEALEASDSDLGARNAQFMLIADEVKQHILEEETELFPMLSKLERLNLDALAADMKARKSELMAETGLAEVSVESA